VNGEVIKLDVNKLGFYEKPMIIAGKIDGDFTNLDPDNLNGYLTLKDFAFSDTKEVYPVQELNLKASSTNDSTQIVLNSQVADVELKGKYKLTQIFGSLSILLINIISFKTRKSSENSTGTVFYL
jgi:hypothetical protein